MSTARPAGTALLASRYANVPAMLLLRLWNWLRNLLMAVIRRGEIMVEEQTTQRTHTITITVSDTGEFHYHVKVDPPHREKYHASTAVRVRPGDTVEWVYNEGPMFAVDFGWGSPLNDRRFHAPDHRHPDWPAHTISAKVRAGAVPKNYKYTVAVVLGEDLWTEDPDLIVIGEELSGGW